MIRYVLVVGCTGLAFGGSAFAQGTPGPGSLSDSRLAEVLEGDPYVRVTQDGNNNRAELIAIIDAPPAEVWEVLMDYEDFEDWFPDQRESRVVSTSGDSRVIEGETRIPIFRNRTYQLRDSHRTEERDGVTVYIDEWEYIEGSGNIDSNSGFWYAEPYGEGQTWLRMVLEADLGMWLPDAVLNWGTRRVLPGIVEGLEEQLD